MNYTELILKPEPFNPWSEILMAKLGDEGYDSFVEENGVLKAYIPQNEFNKEVIDDLKEWSESVTFSLDIRQNSIAQQNWNANWESQFSPIVLGSWCGIRAPFHDPLNVEYEIIIEPKMSFGTGHHQTTYMMMEMMSELDIKNRKVLDMGCGTGILAILAQKLQAEYVEGIDNEEWAYENSLENAERNGVAEIVFKHGEKELIPHFEFDIILANINRNILIDMMPELSKAVIENGKLVLSGFLQSDQKVMLESTEAHGFKLIKTKTKDNWLSLCFEKL